MREDPYYFSPLAPFADAMTNVGRAIEQQYERMQVEYVFGLTGGELDDKPLQFCTPIQGGEMGEYADHEWLYHYDGVPEWAGTDFEDKYHPGVDYFTLVEPGCDYGSNAPEWLTVKDGKVYVRVAQYAHSGETECPMGSCGDDEIVGEESTEGMARCPLCDERKGEKHGYIYLGAGCESVYKHMDVHCEECGLTRVDMTPEAPTCDCEEG